MATGQKKNYEYKLIVSANNRASLQSIDKMLRRCTDEFNYLLKQKSDFVVTIEKPEEVVNNN